MAAALLVAAGCYDIAGPPSDLPAVWVAVDAGDYHTCAIDADGRAYCWGSNQYGQLGAEDTELSPWPHPVAGDLRFVDISAGFSHSCAVTVDGEAYCWGLGRHGQLGQGATDDASRPTLVAGTYRFRKITAGHSHTCAITIEGRAVCWGDNAEGQLGNGVNELAQTESSLTPVIVGDGELRFLSLSAGHTHSCGAVSNGLTYCWGSNRQAQLGNASFEPAPLPVSVHGQVPIAGISAGSETTCGITLGGVPECWGSNEGGKLANSLIALAGNPIPVATPAAFNGISVGSGWHVCGVSALGRAYCWGRGKYGQLGDGLGEDSVVPVVATGDAWFVAVTAGLRHTCALAADGGIWCWGDGSAGQLGAGGFGLTLDPLPVAR